MPTRCAWVPPDDPLYVEYHDTEWGVPVRDDRTMFEFLTLESAQAGLSWITVLRKRENYRRAFEGFDPERVAGFGEDRLERMLEDRGLIRNRAKLSAAISNAARFLEVAREFGSFCDYIWRFTGGAPIVNRRESIGQIPATSPEAEELSRDLKARGFRFVGPTIIYAHMQATGMVNDHTTGCFRHSELAGP